MSNIYIREFDESDFQFYKECLSDNIWRKSFGEDEEPRNLDLFITDRLKSYPFVKRYIFLNQNQKKVAFIIADFGYDNSEKCIMGGGVAINLIGKGYGIKCSIKFCHHIFENFRSIKSIVAYHQNIPSRQMLLKIGFSKNGFIEVNQKENELTLLKNSFPNSFCSQILNRLKYAQR